MTKKAQEFFKNSKANRMLWGSQPFIDERDAIKIAEKYARKVNEEKEEIIKWVVENRHNRKMNNSLFFNMLTAKMDNIK